MLLSGTSALEGDESSTPLVRIGVQVRNTAADPVSLGKLCIVQVRASRGSTGGTPAWKAPASPLAGCAHSDSGGAIPAGARFHLHADASFAYPTQLDILGDDLEEGVTNRRPDRVFLVGSRATTCAVQLFGYRSADARDRWYLQERPDWYSSSCPLKIPPSWLDPEETRTFRIDLPPSASAVETNLYYLTLTLGVEQEPGGGRRMTLGVGEASLNGF